MTTVPVRAVDALLRTDPQFAAMVEMLYGPGVGADAVYADVFGKLNGPGDSDLSIPGVPSRSSQRRRRGLALAAIAGTGAGALTAVADVKRKMGATGRPGLRGPLALGADVLAGGELYQHLKTITGSKPAVPVAKVALSRLVRGSLTQHRRLVRATLDAAKPVESTRVAADRGAAAVRPSMTKRVSAEWTGEFSKFDEDKRIALGWANVCKVNGQPVLDRQGDYIDADDLEDVVYDYVQRCRIGGDMHDRVVGKSDGRGLWFGLYGPALDSPRKVADLVESVIITKAKKEVMGLPADYPEGWWCGFRYHDEEIWKAIRSGERTGFSIHGSGLRVPVDYDTLMGVA